MKRKRMELLLIVLTMLALGAGVAAGLLAARLPAVQTAQSAADDRSPLVEALGLTPDQCNQMRSIWEAVRTEIRTDYDRAQSLERQRDDALLALLNDEQKTRFEQISKDFAGKFTELTQSRDQAFRDAVARTKALLDPQQQKKYDEILSAQVPSAMGPGAGSEIGPPLE